MIVSSNKGVGMQDENNDQFQPDDGASNRLSSVKSRAMDALVTILPDVNNFSAERRFEIYVNKVRDNGDATAAESALDAALAIEDKDARADALSELIDEIDYRDDQATA